VAAVLRSVRVAAIAAIIVSMIGLGVVAGLLLVANAGWVPVTIHPWLTTVVGDHQYEVRLPALIAGWLLAPVLLGGLVLWALFYLWRRRQYEALIGRLERELARLRNLPFVEPAPLEDLPEHDPGEAGAAARDAAEGDDAADHGVD
jgi:hypothetical protein